MSAGGRPVVPGEVCSRVVMRAEVTRQDSDVVREIVAATGFFSAAEVDVAVELVDERLSKGPASGYEFLFADVGGETIGYACYGPIACTVGSYDLYWLAVRPEYQGHGLGRLLMWATEDRIRAVGGRRVYIETSGREQYFPTRAFYERCGYRVEAMLADFYSPGDAKYVYCRPVPSADEAEGTADMGA